jgi:hypothetical protein
VKERRWSVGRCFSKLTVEGWSKGMNGILVRPARNSSQARVLATTSAASSVLYCTVHKIENARRMEGNGGEIKK